jgi:hypothetical protein
MGQNVKETLDEKKAKRDPIIKKLMAEIAAGRDLSQITKHDKNSKYPGYSTIRKWIAEDEDYQEKWVIAKMGQAESEFEHSSQLLLDLFAKKIDAPSAKVALEIIKWRTSRLYPRKYLDRILGGLEDTNVGAINVRMPELEQLLKSKIS